MTFELDIWHWPLISDLISSKWPWPMSWSSYLTLESLTSILEKDRHLGGAAREVPLILLINDSKKSEGVLEGEGKIYCVMNCWGRGGKEGRGTGRGEGALERKNGKHLTCPLLHLYNYEPGGWWRERKGTRGGELERDTWIKEGRELTEGKRDE